jgi:type IV secretion system protein VirD4
MSTGAKVAITAVGAAVCIAAGTWLSGAIFMAASERSLQRVPNVKLTSLPRYWSEYSEHEVMNRRLKASTAAGYGVTCLVLPGLLAAGFAGRRRSLYGEARFANMAEMKAAKLLDGDGIIVGKYRGRYLAFPGQQYVWVAAPPRSGKGRGIAVPNLLNWPGSVIALDFKDELFQLTSGFRAESGHKVFRFAPFDSEGRTARFNPLGYVRTDELHRVSDLMAIGHIVYPEPTNDSGGSAKFFADSARNVFLALGLYLLESPELPRTFGQMLRLASGNGKPFNVYLTELIQDRVKQKRPLSQECVDAFNRFLANTAQVFSSILSTFTSPLTQFMDPIMDAATSADDFDLEALRKELISVYLCIPFEKVSSAKLIVNLLYTLAINLNTRVLPKPEGDPVYPHKCLLLFDEFAVPGRIDVLTRSIGLMPGYNMRVLIICQSESQVAFEYGRDTAKTMRTAMAMQVLFPPKEQEDAEAYSKMLDNCTEKVRSRNSSSGRGGSSHGHSEQQHKRPLMLPQEIKRIGTKRQIIVMENCLPIYCERANYDQDPELDRRSKIPPMVVPPLDMSTHMARINLCVRAMEPGEGEQQPVPVKRMVPDFKAMPPLKANASDADIDKWTDGFFDAVQVAAASVAEAAERKANADVSANTPEQTEKPKKPSAKKNAARKKPATKKKAAEPPPESDEERWAADYAAAEEELDLSSLHQRHDDEHGATAGN